MAEDVPTPAVEPVAAAPEAKAAEPVAAEPAKAAESAPSAEPAKAVEPTPEPAKAEPPKADEPLFTLPEDFKPPESMVKRFTETMGGKWKDGVLTMKPQEVADLYVEMARAANQDWEKQLETLNASNEAECKKRFSSEDLRAAETAVGWFSSFEPKFNDFARRQLNDPTFVSMMRIVGEALGEDTFEPAGAAPAPKRSSAQIMGYDKSN